MNTHDNFLSFNGKNIVFINNEGNYWIAIRPICDALNVDYAAQLKRLKNDVILGSVYAKHTMQVPYLAEKKDPVFQGRKMISLPEMYIYGWIFSINSKSEELIEYKKTCYETLYKHFHGTITGRKDLLIKRDSVDKDIALLKEEMKGQDENYKKLKKLESKRKAISEQLNNIDKTVIQQYKMVLN